jgi:hypothetical protein
MGQQQTAWYHRNRTHWEMIRFVSLVRLEVNRATQTPHNARSGVRMNGDSLEYRFWSYLTTVSSGGMTVNA